MDALKQLKLAKNGYIIMSVLFMVLGACLIIWPDCSMAVFLYSSRDYAYCIRIDKDSGIIFPEISIVWHFSLILPLECCWQQ